MSMADAVAKAAKDGLETIVKEFNNRLSKWEDLTNGRAMFQWHYPDDSSGKARLRIKESSIVLHDSEPASEEVLKLVVDKVANAQTIPLKGDPR